MFLYFYLKFKYATQKTIKKRDIEESFGLLLIVMN